MLERARGFSRVHVDVGAGDGAFAYRIARADPTTLVVAVDANGAGLIERSRRAAAKPARGGASNARFARASVEAFPSELDGLATRITVLFPWGTLLRGVTAPEPAILERLRRVCRNEARLEIVLGLTVDRESA